MGGKVVKSVVSLILVVGVVIGAVMIVRHENNDAADSPSSGASMKSMTTFCNPAPFKDACIKSIQSVANNASATPKDYLIAALQSTVVEVYKGLDVVGQSQLHTLNDRVHQLLNWLSAVHSYQSYCIDEFQKPEYKSSIQKGIDPATQLTDLMLRTGCGQEVVGSAGKWRDRTKCGGSQRWHWTIQDHYGCLESLPA